MGITSSPPTAACLTFGDAEFQGSTGSIQLNKPVVGMTVDPATCVLRLVHFAYNAPFLGSTGSMALNKPVVGMAAVGLGDRRWRDLRLRRSYWGSTGSIHLRQAGRRDGLRGEIRGYWLVASDGGVFAYNAPFYGSTGGIALNAPIVGMEATASGHGYRFIGADGGSHLRSLRLLRNACLRPAARVAGDRRRGLDNARLPGPPQD